jgi:Lon protease-like protein
MQLPLCPLSSIVMPGGLLPLRLFEQRYIEMVKNCFKTDTGFGICLIKNGTEAGEPSQPYPVGTEVSIIDFNQGADGLLQITTRGETEFRLLTYTTTDNKLLIGDIKHLPPVPPLDMQPEYELLARKLDLILQYVEPDVAYPEKHLDDADWVCHRLLELLPLAAPVKYRLLQMQGNRERLESLGSLQIEISDR